jgi:hypothetical protein
MNPEDILTKYMQLLPDMPLPEDPTVLMQTLFWIIHEIPSVFRLPKGRIYATSFSCCC